MSMDSHSEISQREKTRKPSEEVSSHLLVFLGNVHNTRAQICVFTFAPKNFKEVKDHFSECVADVLDAILWTCLFVMFPELIFFPFDVNR